MGGQISTAMEGAQTKMFEKQKAAQKRMMERQLEVQRTMVAKQMAMQIARQRDMFHFYSAFAIPAICALGIAGLRKNPALFGPILPLSVAWAYQYDMAYNNKLDRLRATAADILRNEPAMVALPGVWPTIDDIDASIEKARVDAAVSDLLVIPKETK